MIGIKEPAQTADGVCRFFADLENVNTKLGLLDFKRLVFRGDLSNFVRNSISR